jgi:hypothetical protein
MTESIYFWLYLLPRLLEWVICQLAFRLLPQLVQRVKPLFPSSLTGHGSLEIFKQLPTEILADIFVHTCGDEYIGFVDHFSLPPEESTWFVTQEGNTVYTLKAVCKDWKELADRTPGLWRRICFSFNDLYPGDGYFRSPQHFEDMAKRVLLPRSAGLDLYLQIHGHECLTEPDSDTQRRSRYFIPLLRILAQEGHRWVSVDFSDLELPEGGAPPALRLEILRTLENVIAATQFPRLRYLSYLSASEEPDLIAPKLDFSSNAPQLKGLTLRIEDLQISGGLLSLLQCRWDSLTSLVIDPEGSPPASWASLVRPLLPVLHATRQSLEHFHLRGSCVYDLEPPEDAQPISRRPKQVQLDKLRKLVLEDTQAMQLCGALLPRLSCPNLQTVEVLLCRPPEIPSIDASGLWEGAVPSRLTIFERFLASVPLLQTLTILQIPNLPYYEVRRDIPRMDNEHIRHGYLVVGGMPAQVREAVETCLKENDVLSSIFDGSSLPFVLSPPFANIVKSGVLARVMGFVPCASYAPIPVVGRFMERPRLLPRRIMTGWEDRHRRDRYDEEVEHIGRLFRFSQVLSLSHDPSGGGGWRDRMRALDALDKSSIVILVHLLTVIVGFEAMPHNCNITLSVAV